MFYKRAFIWATGRAILAIVSLGLSVAGEFPYPHMVADLNGDGILDAVVVGYGTAGVFLGLGDGTFAAPFYEGLGPSPDDLFVANLHGQEASAGLPDIVEPDSTGGVLVLINSTKR